MQLVIGNGSREDSSLLPLGNASLLRHPFTGTYAPVPSLQTTGEVSGRKQRDSFDVLLKVPAGEQDFWSLGGVQANRSCQLRSRPQRLYDSLSTSRLTSVRESAQFDIRAQAGRISLVICPSLKLRVFPDPG